MAVPFDVTVVGLLGWEGRGTAWLRLRPHTFGLVADAKFRAYTHFLFCLVLPE